MFLRNVARMEFWINVTVTNIGGAYTAGSKPHFGKCDHLAILLNINIIINIYLLLLYMTAPCNWLISECSIQY